MSDKSYTYSITCGTNCRSKYKESDKMKTENLKLKNDKYHTTMYVKDENNNRLKTKIEIECDDFEIFSKIVKVVDPILKEEVEK